jgi:ATP-dependent DNA helicase PIF1
MENMCPFLNNFKFPGIPDHQLKQKVGLAVMLLCNINQTAGLCNGVRITRTHLGNKYIEAEVITGTHVGICIPWIIMSPSLSKWPFVLKGRQHPLSVCFTMTKSKSQCQS